MRATAAGRLLIGLGAVCLAASVWLPYWGMRVSAPQYPKGLHLTAYLDRLEGDVREIDGLNHYIGMRPLGEAAVIERKLGIPGVWAMAAGLLLIAWLGRRRRWLFLLVLPAVAFPWVFASDLYWWLRDFGLNLDPRAPLSSAVKPFVPPLFGTGKIAQFASHAWFGPGFYLAVAASVAALIGCGLLWRIRASRAARVLLLGAGLSLIASSPTGAATWRVEPASVSGSLAQALAQAQDGDTIIVVGGEHPGPVQITQSVALLGQAGAVIDGGGRGHVVDITAPGVTLRGFVIRGSGDVLSQEHAGVVVTAPEATIEGNRFEDVLFGVYLRRAPRSRIRGNVLRGKPLPLPRRGDLIRVWYSDDVAITGNDVAAGRDVVLWFSNRLTLADNTITGGRYGIHFMYCDAAAVEANRIARNSVGAYLMYSQRLALRENRITHNRGASGYGVGLKDMEAAELSGNVIADNRVGIFLDNAAGRYARNLIAYNDQGLQVLASSRRNAFLENSLVDNAEQVVSDEVPNRWHGNYWSDYRGIDADGDGIGDTPYQAVELFERLADRYPVLRLYAQSPVAEALEFSARLFPMFAPKPRLRDVAPRMAPLLPGIVRGAELPAHG